VSGIVKTDDQDPAKSEVEVTIDAASIDSREPQRDAHLRSADFFDVEQHPAITFRSRRVEDVRGETFRLVGDLTMHGVTREVALEVTSHGRAKDPWGGERAGFSATAKVKRSDFGLTWNQLLETGGVAVGDEIKISIDAELVKG
jgi:polyisoprenoid-binding protein YceI